MNVELPSLATLQEIRAQFPALERSHNGHPVAYFDGPGGTQVPKQVVEAVTEYLFHHNANTHWNYPTSHETDEILADARTTLADFVGGEPGEIVFGANATALTFHVSRTLARQLSTSDEVVITELDHHANVGPWQALARERGCELRVVKMNTDDGSLDWNDFERKLNQRTKLVALGAASNALGTVNDVQRAARLARAVGALTYVDAVHFAPHFLADVRAMECDFLVCSAYKFYGPHVGVLWCRRELLESLPFPKLVPAPDTAPDRAETGTLNHEGIAGAAAAVDFLASLSLNSPAISPQRVACSDLAGNGPDRPKMGRLYKRSDTRRELLSATFAALDARSATLTNQLWNGLREIDGVTLYGPPPTAKRTSTIAFTLRGIAAPELASHLADRGLFLSHGNFYAHTVVERLGLAPHGLVRAGCACYTTDEEIGRLISAVRELRV
jgi:cysteine desulfurase family protein (TIGR01976 family)